MHYVKALKFQDKPDYSYLKNMFHQILASQLIPESPLEFDWNILNVRNICDLSRKI